MLSIDTYLCKTYKLGQVMDFKELIQKRYSVRNYKEQKVARTLIEQIIAAGQIAPSACNKQPWHFVVVDDDMLLDKVHKVYHREWFQKAPVVIIAYGNHKEAWKRSFDEKDHCDIDVAIAIDHMTLMAAELGLGTCWICHFNPQLLDEVLPTSAEWTPVAILSLGYPNDEIFPDKKRKPIDSIFGYNAW